MKTFKQFAEQLKNDVPDVIKSLQGIAQTAGNTIDPKTVRNKVIGTVFNKLTGGAEGREKGINKIQSKINKMTTDMPKAFDKFEKFLGSGKIEKGFNKASTKLNQVMK